MLATLEGKQLRTSSWASYRVCEVAAVSTGNRSNLPHPGLWAPKQGLKGEKKTASTHRPSGVCTLAKLGFQVFMLCADVCLYSL